jgi:MEKHLA domain
VTETHNEPGEFNQYLEAHVTRLLQSYRHWTGTSLVPPDLSSAEQARQLYHAPFVVLSHNTASDPLLNYANRAGLDLFELSWTELMTLPSRYTAEPLQRQERADLLTKVTQRGYIDDYRGVRISKTGRRFLIERATVWTLFDDGGAPYGQAATFGEWKFLA